MYIDEVESEKQLIEYLVMFGNVPDMYPIVKTLIDSVLHKKSEFNMENIFTTVCTIEAMEIVKYIVQKNIFARGTYIFALCRCATASSLVSFEWLLKYLGKDYSVATNLYSTFYTNCRSIKYAPVYKILIDNDYLYDDMSEKLLKHLNKDTADYIKRYRNLKMLNQ